MGSRPRRKRAPRRFRAWVALRPRSQASERERIGEDRSRTRRPITAAYTRAPRCSTSNMTGFGRRGRRNFVLTAKADVEVQASAEGATMTRKPSASSPLALGCTEFARRTAAGGNLISGGRGRELASLRLVQAVSGGDREAAQPSTGIAATAAPRNRGEKKLWRVLRARSSRPKFAAIDGRGICGAFLRTRIIVEARWSARGQSCDYDGQRVASAAITLAIEQ